MAADDYNKRLFSKSTLRGKIHNARFLWLRENVKRLCPEYNSVLELGCFDGKILNHLPIPPNYYEGWDANWEGGLDIARKTFANKEDISFYECESFEAFQPTRSSFDISICMETLEHLPIYNYEEYIKTLAEHTDGYLFVSIPNEKKVPFVMKHLVKSTVLRKQKMDHYTTKETWNAMLGRLDKVKRINTSHKGFDYEDMIATLRKHFIIESVEGIPYKSLGPSLNFTVGVVCRSK